MTTKDHLEFHGRKLGIKYSKQALVESVSLTREVNLEMELNFSCLVKKSVFETKTRNDSLYIELKPFLNLCFRAITTNVCVPEHINKHEHKDVRVLNIVKPERFVPDWVYIDFKGGKWGGEFGYVSNNKLHM